MKADKMDFAVGNIDDDLVTEAVDTDDRNKLLTAVKEERKKKLSHCVKLYGSLAAALCIVITSAFIIMKRPEADNTAGLVQAVSPITEIASVDEFSDYLGYTLPVIDGKEVSLCLVYSVDKKAYMGEIRYSDSSSFRMSKTEGDISGIYGGHKEDDITYDGITVSIFSMENTKYGIWQNEGFSYCYSTDDKNEDLTQNIKDLIAKGSNTK